MHETELYQLFKQTAAAHSAAWIATRRHLHQHPELSYQEFETAAFVQEKLRALGLTPMVLAQTGVVACVEGKNPTSRVVALRADMDALPIQEENHIPYASTKPGIMHACGHDVHTTCLLGAAELLVATREHWEGTVKFIFQPGEEKNPGGASIMIREGVLDNPKPSAIYALHVHPGLPIGKLSFRGGKVMASADELYITLRAKGGHAAAPHLTADPIVGAAQLVLALQQVVSRNTNPFDPSVLSITSLQGGTTTNVIPREVKMMGTFRAMDEHWRFEAHKRIRQIAEQTAASLSLELDLHIDVGYPFVYNDPALSAKARQVAEVLMGEQNVEETELRMGAEDFAYYTHHIPGCFFRLGTGNPELDTEHGVHTPRFNVDESAIAIGATMLAALATKTM
jgi:hippurate hydrolase